MTEHVVTHQWKKGDLVRIIFDEDYRLFTITHVMGNFIYGFRPYANKKYVLITSNPEYLTWFR